MKVSISALIAERDGGTMPKTKSKHMTVAQAIEWLSKIEDKKMVMMIDCPHCGKGSQIAFIDEVVLLRSKESE